MEMTGVQKLARVLKVLVTMTFICNLIILPMVPAIVAMSLERGTEAPSTWVLFLPLMSFKVWSFFPWFSYSPYAAVLIFFLLFCGACTAVILWQGRRVLDSILRADTFTFSNAGNLKRAAICCFLISAAALVRAVWGLIYYNSLSPLFTYNALFIPIFLMGGLLCLVMSALFRQAAELKSEHDLTI